MPSRRAFLSGLLAAGLCPRPSWADLGSPRFLSAALRRDGVHVLCGLSGNGEILFELPLPARGHAAAAHPVWPQAVAFARRPGRFAIVVDCRTGQRLARLDAPAGRHFYGHGTYSADGTRLYTTENDFETTRGMIGIWDAHQGYRRIGEMPSGGVGPHDLRLMPDNLTLVVANGGIETHPDSGRSKLNLPVMAPNLSYLDLDGQLSETVEPQRALHKNSIRHLAIAADGTVAMAMQWQGDMTAAPPLVALHRRGEALHYLTAPKADLSEMQGYAGSIAIAGDNVAITSPRGGLCQVYSRRSGRLQDVIRKGDVCGIAKGEDGFVLTSGTGRVLRLGANGIRAVTHALQFDNHLVAIPPRPSSP